MKRTVPIVTCDFCYADESMPDGSWVQLKLARHPDPHTETVIDLCKECLPSFIGQHAPEVKTVRVKTTP